MTAREPRPAPPPRHVRFYERAGDDGATELAPLARHWRSVGADVELLRGVDQTERWLLVVREPAAATAAPPPAPAGTREWRFAAVAS